MSGIGTGVCWCGCTCLPVAITLTIHYTTQYDLTVSTYSPDGRVFQTEYAQKAVDNSGYAYVMVIYSDNVGGGLYTSCMCDDGLPYKTSLFPSTALQWASASRMVLSWGWKS